MLLNHQGTVRNKATQETINIFLYLIINSAYVIGILPTTGLPIPFISYGGSQTIFSLLSKSPGIKVIDNPEKLEYPTPLENADDTEDVYVGRIRVQVINNETWVSMWIVADNVYGKGAALNTIQIIESLIEDNKLC